MAETTTTYLGFIKMSGTCEGRPMFKILDERGQEFGRIFYYPPAKEYLAEFFEQRCWSYKRLAEVAQFVSDLQGQYKAVLKT